MYVPKSILRGPYLPFCSPCFWRSRIFTLSRRKYATHRGSLETGSSPLSQSLDTKQRATPRGDSVGPFRLGLAQSSLKRGERVQKWSELSAGGKVLRTTARTSNLTVILLGAGLSALLVYSLTSELFSRNSPTVLYGDACERIKVSTKVAKYLHGPLTFHNNPPSVIRPRHRNRHVISQIMVDAQGQEHMIMTFYVQGRPPGSEALPSEASYMDTAASWAQEKITDLSDLTLNESIIWTREHAHNIWDRARRLFKYLSGAPLPPPSLPPYPEKQVEQMEPERSTAWSFADMFSALKSSPSSQSKPIYAQEGRVYTDGEVHASFIRNNDGYFVFRYLLVDIPSSRNSNPVRVFVERAPGVRDNEPVMRWNSS